MNMRPSTWVLAAALVVADTPGLALSASANEAPVRKVLVIGIDGLRADALEQADAPYLQGLIAEGAYSPDAQCESMTFSGPNWSTIMTGVHIDRHDVHSNSYRDSKIDRWPDFFTYLEQHDPDWVTARLITWDSFHNNQPTGADIDLFANYRDGGDERMTEQAVRLLSGTDPDITRDPDAMFIYFADVDVAGHDRRGGFSPEASGYLHTIAETDARVGRLLDVIDARPNRADEHWLIVITSDHGGNPDHEHHGNTAERRNIPFIVAGEDAAPGPIFPNARNVDVAKTVLTYMGVPIDPAWQLDGHAVGLEPTAAPVARYGANLIFNGDAEYDRGFAQTKAPKFDQYASGWRDDGPAMINILTYAVDTEKYPDYLSPADSEKVGGGANFFGGGYAPVSRITQTIDLTPLAADIDAKKVDYHLSALLGGWKNNQDSAAFIARFHDGTGHMIQTVTLGPVSAADRSNRTGLLPREATGMVTPSARNVTVELLCVRFSGKANDGYADNLSLVLGERPTDAP